jgi:hypothetical protein
MQKQIEMPDVLTCTDKQWTKWWWQDYSELCKSCVNNCKQSWRVGLNCGAYKKKAE